MSRKRFGRNQKRRLKAEVAEAHAALQSHRDMYRHINNENDHLKKTLHRIIDHFTEINQHSIFLEPKRGESAPRQIGVSPPMRSYSDADMIMEKAFFITEQVARIKVKMENTQDVAHGRELFHVHMLVDENRELSYCVDFKYLREHGFKHIKRQLDVLFEDAFEKYRLSL